MVDDVACTTKSVGTTTRGRQLAAAAALLAGAVACGTATAAGWPLDQTLAVLGAAATVAWLVGGDSRRFMGPGLAAVAVGGGITLYRSLEMGVVLGQRTVVLPMLGAALLVASIFNPMAIRGAGAFLVTLGAVAYLDTPWDRGWTLAAILVAWAGVDLLRIRRQADVDPRESSTVGPPASRRRLS